MTFIPLLSPSEKLDALRLEAENHTSMPHSVDALRVRCALAAADGRFAEAQSIAELAWALFRNAPSLARFEVALYCLFISQDFASLSQLICDRGRLSIPLKINVEELGIREGIFRLAFPAGNQLIVTFDVSALRSNEAFRLIVQFNWVVPMFAAYAASPGHKTGITYFDNGDSGLIAGLAMCSNLPTSFLVPDNVFVPTRGYQSFRTKISNAAPPWEHRIPMAFWRGSTTGRPTDPSVGWLSLPRIRLCKLGRDNPDIIDAGITRIAQILQPDAQEVLAAMQIMRAHVAAELFANYKYQIDIDGNTNAWSALFQKLLTGSPVLKVASPYGYRQWYYDRLKPWVNYVPVESDMTDLVEKVRWLVEHDDLARKIGDCGRDLALSMTYHREILHATRTIEAAVRYEAKTAALARLAENPIALQTAGIARVLASMQQDGNIGEGLIALLHETTQPFWQHITSELEPILDDEDWAKFAQMLISNSLSVAKFAAIYPEDIWANTGLVELYNWLLKRESSLQGAASGIESAEPSLVQKQDGALKLASKFDYFATRGSSGTPYSLAQAVTVDARRTIEPRRNLCLIATARNEGLYLIEWIAYHRLIGFEKIFLYSNDNQDESDNLLAALAACGEIIWINSDVANGGNAQIKAYGHALNMLPDVLDYEWALIIDLDEFMVFDTHKFSSVGDFVAQDIFKTADGICISCAGACIDGQRFWYDAPMIERFSVSAAKPSAEVKTLFRPARFMHSSAHVPRMNPKLKANLVTPLGTEHLFGIKGEKRGLPQREWPALSDNPDIRVAAINHYFFKSAEEFLWKASRNRGDHAKEDAISSGQRLLPFLQPFVKKFYEVAQPPDGRARACAPGLVAEMARLRHLPGVAAAEAQVRACFQRRMPEILKFFATTPGLMEDASVQKMIELATRPAADALPVEAAALAQE